MLKLIFKIYMYVINLVKLHFICNSIFYILGIPNSDQGKHCT